MNSEERSPARVDVVMGGDQLGSSLLENAPPADPQTGSDPVAATLITGSSPKGSGETQETKPEATVRVRDVQSKQALSREEVGVQWIHDASKIVKRAKGKRWLAPLPIRLLTVRDALIAACKMAPDRIVWLPPEAPRQSLHSLFTMIISALEERVQVVPEEGGLERWSEWREKRQEPTLLAVTAFCEKHTANAPDAMDVVAAGSNSTIALNAVLAAVADDLRWLLKP